MLLVEHTYEAQVERAATTQRDAHQHRQAAAARRARQPVRLARTRRAVGHGLVRLGERLAGTEPQRAARAA